LATSAGPPLVADQQPFCKPEDGLKNVFVEGSVLPRQFG